MKIFTGRTCKQTDKKILETIKERIESDPLSEIMVIVPSQATYITEKYILDKLGLKGMMGLEVLSPERLAQKINDKTYGRALPLLDDAGKCMLFCLILSLYKDELPTFSFAPNITQTAKQLCDLSRETKIMDISPEDLKNFETEDEDLAKKLRELSFIFEKFNEYTSSFGITQQDRTNIAIEHLGEYGKLKDYDVFVMGFDVFSEQFLRCLEKLDRYAKSLTMSMLDSAPCGDEDVFALPKSYIKRISQNIKTEIKEAEDIKDMSPDIAFLEKYIFAYPFEKKSSVGDVELIKAEDKEKEIMACLEKTAMLIKNGTDPSEIAVVAADINAYSRHIKKYFGDSNIPYFFDEKRLLSENVLSDFILSALRLCVGRLDKMRLLENINCGFYGSEEQRILADKMIRTRIGNIYRITKPFDNEKEESARKKCVLPVLDFIACARKSKTQNELILNLEKFISRSDAFSVLKKEEDSLRAAGCFDAADYYSQIPEKISRIFAMARTIEGKANVKLLYDMLKAAFVNTSVSLIPVTADSVFFGNVVASRLPEIKALFILGMNDGVLPNCDESQGILSEKQKNELLYSLRSQPESTELLKQKLALYKMISSPKEKLFVSYYGSEGKEVAYPSFVATKMAEILKLEAIPASSFIGSALRSCALEVVKDDIRAELSGEESFHKDLLLFLKSEDSVKENIARCYDLFISEKPSSIPGETARQLYDLTGSVSKFQKFFACPYRFFMQYGIKPEVSDMPQLQANNIGTYIHDLLDTYIRDLASGNVMISELSDAEMKERLDAVAEKVRNKDEKYTNSKENILILDALEKEVLLVLSAIRKEKSVAQSVIAATEMPFEENIGGTKIIGVIDRVDTGEVDGEKYYSIVDYKSGKTDFSLENLVKGLSLQLTLYMIAAKRLFDARPAGAGYINVAYPQSEEFDEEQNNKQFKTHGVHVGEKRILDAMFGVDSGRIVGLNMKITKKGTIFSRSAEKLFTHDEITEMMLYTEKMIKKAVREITGGNIQAEPVANAEGKLECTFCDYATVCGHGVFDDVSSHKKMDRQEAFEMINKELQS